MGAERVHLFEMLFDPPNANAFKLLRAAALDGKESGDRWIDEVASELQSFPRSERGKLLGDLALHMAALHRVFAMEVGERAKSEQWAEIASAALDDWRSDNARDSLIRAAEAAIASLGSRDRGDEAPVTAAHDPDSPFR